MKKRKLYLLLTQFPDSGSKLLRRLTGFSYNHASLGLEEDPNTFYSFVLKGFLTEKITRYVKPDREPFPCKLYELYVTQEVYDRISELIGVFIRSRNEMKYTRFGVFMSLLHIPYKREYKYFCSQFVAYILERCNAVSLYKDSALYLPEDIGALPGARLAFQGDLCGMIERFGIAAN